MVWDGPVTMARDDDPDVLVETWAARLSAVTRRAEAIVGEITEAEAHPLAPT
jgi:hypothetical protein